MILITLSEHGMLISRGKDYKVIPTQARDVADVSGAGDTVIAMASLCLALGMDAIRHGRPGQSRRRAGLRKSGRGAGGKRVA